MNYKSIAFAFIGLILYYSLFPVISPFIENYVGDNTLVDFMAKLIPLIIFLVIIVSAFTGNNGKNYKYNYLLVVGGVFLLFASPVTAGLTDNLIRAYDYTNMSYTDLTGNGADFTMYNFFSDSNNGTMTGFDRNDGTVSGGVTISDGAMVFDGVDGYLYTDNLALNNEFSISYYIKPNSLTQNYNGLIDIWTSNIFLTRIKDDKLRIEINFVSGTTSKEISNIFDSTSSYIHIVHIYTSSGLLTYKNNVLVDTSFINYNFSPTSSILNIGKFSTSFFNGSINNVQIFNKALTQSEITEIYNAGRDSYSPISDGLVAQYSGRDFAGTESSPTTIYDTNMLVAGHSDDVSALSFDGVDDYVNTDSLNDYDDKISVFYWMKPLETADYFRVYEGLGTTLPGGTYSPATFGITGSGFLGFQIYASSSSATGSDTVVSNTSLQLNTWQQVGLVYDYNTDKVELYINGILDKTDYLTGKPYGKSNFKLIGVGKSAQTHYFNGSIDNVLIYDRALSQDEITEIYEVGQYAQFTPISDGLVFQHTLDSDYIEIATNTSIDNYRFTHETLTNTTRIKFNETVGTYLYTNSNLNDYISRINNNTISFFENVTAPSSRIFMIRNTLSTTILLSHYLTGGTLRTGIFDNVDYGSVGTTQEYNELRNLIIETNTVNLDQDSNYYYNGIPQTNIVTGAFTVDGVAGFRIGQEFYGYFSNFLVWDVNNLTDLQIRLINGGWSYNNRHKTGIAVQNIFSEDFYDDYIIQVEDLTTNIKTNYTAIRGVVFVNLDDAKTYNITAYNINDDFADLTQEITGTELEVLFSVYDYNSILINVYDEETKELITDNITLKYSKDVTTTLVNNTGRFYLTDLESGEYQLNLFGDDYLSRYYYVSVVNNANATLNAYLLKTSSSLARAVNVLCGSNPIEDALISFYIAYDPASYTLVAQRYTDGFGQANFFLNPDTTYRLVIEDGDDIYISSVIPTSTPITVNICQDSDQPYNFTKVQDQFSYYITPVDKLISANTTNFTLEIVSAGGYISAFGINSTYNGVFYSESLSNSTSGGSVMITIPINVTKDVIYIYWFVNTTDNLTFSSFELYRTKLFENKGDVSIVKTLEDFDADFESNWRYLFITFVVFLVMLGTAPLVNPLNNSFIGFGVFCVFILIGWISVGYLVPMGAVLVLYYLVRR